MRIDLSSITTVYNLLDHDDTVFIEPVSDENPCDSVKITVGRDDPEIEIVISTKELRSALITCEIWAADGLL